MLVDVDLLSSWQPSWMITRGQKVSVGVSVVVRVEVLVDDLSRVMGAEERVVTIIDK